MEKATREHIHIPRLWCSARFNLALLSMLGCVCFYALRVNVSFTIVCMVNHSAIAIPDEKDSATDGNHFHRVAVTPGKNNISDSDYGDTDTNDNLTSNSVGVTSYYYNFTDNLWSNGSVADFEGKNNSPSRSHCQAQDESAASYEDGDLAWTKEEQGLVLGSIFWGYMLTNIAGGVVATRYGAKRVIAAALALSAILTAVTPAAARSGVYLVMVVRIFIGVCLGCISPAMHALWAQWAPPQESSKLRSMCFAGCQMGYVVTFPATALLCDYGFDGGWPSVFYSMAAIVLVWCVLWMVTVTDSPVDHPRICPEEKEYIVTSLKGTVSMNRKGGHSVPWLKVLASRPVWASFLAHTCFNWGEYTFLTNIPTYLREVLLFDIKANGVLSAVPYMCFWLVINVSGYVADIVRQKELMNTTHTRNCFNFLGSVVPALFLIAVGFLDCSHSTVAVALLTVGVAMTGCLYGAGLYINYSDLSPRHAGVIYGISNTIATIPGFVAPIVIGVITHDQSQESWRWVFFLASFIFVLGWLVFALLGSGDIQPWAIEADPQDVTVDSPDDNSSPLTQCSDKGNDNDNDIDGNHAANGSALVVREEVKC